MAEANDTPQASWIWIKDSSGYPSVTVTFATVSFWVTTLLVILSSVESIGSVKFRPFDVGAAGAYFVPILTFNLHNIRKMSQSTRRHWRLERKTSSLILIHLMATDMSLV
jgi:hypothetical protein